MTLRINLSPNVALQVRRGVLKRPWGWWRGTPMAVTPQQEQLKERARKKRSIAGMQRAYEKRRSVAPYLVRKLNCLPAEPSVFERDLSLPKEVMDQIDAMELRFLFEWEENPIDEMDEWELNQAMRRSYRVPRSSLHGIARAEWMTKRRDWP